MKPIIVSALIVFVNCTTLFGQTPNLFAPGAPGADAHWPTAAKSGFGTANSLRSKVWFTLAEGVMTEVYYPTLDVPNVQTLQLVVTQGNQVETELEDTVHRVGVPDAAALTFRQVNTAKSGAYKITKTYLADPERNSVLVDVSFETNHADGCKCSIYVYYDPSLNNSGMHDSAWTDGNWLVSADSDKASALTTIEYGFDNAVNGYLGSSDGLTQLRSAGTIARYERADKGNVVQMARVRVPSGLAQSKMRFTLVLSFGRNAGEAITNGAATARKGFAATRAQYEQGWHSYAKTLPRVEPKYQQQFNMSAMVLRALEDKTYRGAMIASPSIPWGGGPNANEATVSGYHAVWSRDLYQVATAFHAIGDHATANRALDYLFRVQQKSDGSFPQNSSVDGRPIGDGLQMDQVALPLIMAYQFGRTDRKTWLKHIKPAADFIAAKGPATIQDRWEEKPGYSPATIAAEIAGLVCAAHIARLNGAFNSARAYLKRADGWVENIERWTSTSTGSYQNGRYYLRITANDNPNDGAKIEINSGGGSYDERKIIDAGFLELVRLGIKTADDPLVMKSVAVVDKLLKVETRAGDAWYRYNHDAYGERLDGKPYDGRSGAGRLWVLLTGERGEYELARGDLAAARKRLDTMLAFANDGLMIPEQVWDRSATSDSAIRLGSGTGSATPLAWSMAQFIRLTLNLKSGRNLETPAIVMNRYRDWKANERPK
jgi:glucoamylase